MVQWAPGTKMQRFSRVDDDSAYRRSFDVMEKNEKRGKPRNDHIDLIKEGDLLLVQGVIQKAGKVDYETKSVMIGPHRHGFSACKRVPQWMDGAWILMEQHQNEIDFDFRAPVVKVFLEPHPNADHLSIVNLYGYTVVVQTEEFKDAKTAAWVLPNSRIINDDPYYEWLGREKRRVRVRKYRGIKSHGFLIPIEDWYGVGTDVGPIKGIWHYKSKAVKV
jgi:hypothetical protein